jgi:hypothetical protein
MNLTTDRQRERSRVNGAECHWCAAPCFGVRFDLPRLLLAAVVAVVVTATGYGVGVAAEVARAGTALLDVDALVCTTCATDRGPAPIDWVRVDDVPDDVLAALRGLQDEAPITLLQVFVAAQQRTSTIATHTTALVDAVFDVDTAVERLVLARAIEHRLSARQQLEVWMNRHTFAGERGLAAAAAHVFGVPAGALSPSQAALLRTLRPETTRAEQQRPALAIVSVR